MPFPIFDKKEDVPKGFEAEYEEREGKWHPKAPADNATELKDTLKKVRADLDAAEKARKDLERKLAAADTEEGKDKVTKALAKFDEDLKAEKEKFEKAIAARDAELRTLKLDDKIKAAFLKAGGRSERAEKALNDTKARFDLGDDGRIIVKNEKGEATTTTVEDFFGKTYKTEMLEFYTGTRATGGNATGGAGASTQTGQKWDGDAVIKNPLAALQAANEEAAAASSK